MLTLSTILLCGAIEYTRYMVKNVGSSPFDLCFGGALFSLCYTMAWLVMGKGKQSHMEIVTVKPELRYT